MELWLSFIIKELANEFGGIFECLQENTEKYKIFFVPTEKEVIKTDKDGNESAVTICYEIKFIDSVRFMLTLLSCLVDNPTEGIHKIKCKDCYFFLKCESAKDNLIKYKFLSCNKNYSNKADEEFNNALKFYNNGINKFILLIRKIFYLYEYMDEW